ncbi:MAG: zf-HC2 domain-containing protein [Clostridia bacterium]|nr:zf-HC2 domain-containing protein [Clostridia bacterium]
MNSITCDESRVLLDRLLDGETLTEAEAEALRAHEAACPDCALLHEALALQDEDLRALADETPPMPADLHDSWMDAVKADAAQRAKPRRRTQWVRWLSVAAMAVLVLGGTLLTRDELAKRRAERADAAVTANTAVAPNTAVAANTAVETDAAFAANAAFAATAAPTPAATAVPTAMPAPPPAPAGDAQAAAKGAAPMAENIMLAARPDSAAGENRQAAEEMWEAEELCLETDAEEAFVPAESLAAFAFADARTEDEDGGTEEAPAPAPVPADIQGLAETVIKTLIRPLR